MKKAFTLIEMLVVTLVITIITWILIKTIQELNIFSATTMENINNVKNELITQEAIKKNNLKDVLFYYSPADNLYYANNKTVFDNNVKNTIIDILNKLNIVYWQNIDLNWTKVDLPVIVFSTYQNKLVILWYQKRKEDTNDVLDLKLYKLNNEYYFKTKWAYTLDDIVYYYTSSNTKYNDYINDLQLSSIDLINNILPIENVHETYKSNIFKEVTLSDLKNAFFITLTNNINVFTDNNLSSKTTLPATYNNYIEKIWNKKLYFFQFNIKYYQNKWHSIFFNWLIK